ncbi:class I SAM-dependent methyltransferase [[Mycobacterium] burgundiense]|uniref:Class I SAM-dependent methyltransferase n=1 Tax=[Mycobacterium] burgundiense TaxID=3064286 RepID=A0ABN9N061_9MYCO|nr:class I SAM-dependent methyltransferase [Mycolicibacterium sp. MU0053]CAJ1498137.1 class I SAM-dependent methyltransferase [Mycolicibacterium sp. MU0053]
MTSPGDDAIKNDATKHKAQLTGVSETALLTLYGRAREAGRPDGVIDDPMAIRLLDSIDYDFSRFGSPRQDMSIRAKTFDRWTTKYLSTHPDATVVALAEGLQTSFWRIDAALPGARFRWVTVDLPPIVDIRHRLLPASPRIELRAQSALDYGWMDQVDATAGVFITAEGLLMYLQPEQSLDLIAECAKRFPGAQMLFDVPPAWFAGLSRRGWLRTSLKYTVPAMPFSLTPTEAAKLIDLPGVRSVRDIQLEPGRGAVINGLISLAHSSKLFHPLRGVLTLLEFG